jgi:FtsP/CotA-like multicopper oxidase with cupredoxin domain
MCRALAALAVAFFALPAGAQTFRVQCPQATADHPLVNASGQAGQPDSTLPNPNIKCQQISGGDGFATMADGTQTYLFAFGPLSGLANIYQGLPGTTPASEFNQPSPTGVGTPSSLVGMPDASFAISGANGALNQAIGQVPDPDAAGALTGHVDPRQIMDVGVLNGSAPAPLMAIDEDDEFFLTLTNVGQVMRPDLFEQHTVHFHGYPNASAFYDGVPDASIAINIGGSFTYYYLAPDAGTYFWHCHIPPPAHLEMGMVGQIYVRPRQNRVIGNLRGALAALNAPPADPLHPSTAEFERIRKRCDSDGDILCSNPVPPINNASNDGTRKYAYNDGDGSTAYDVEYPIQMHGFDPNFHFVGMTFNPESFVDLKDKYFLLNGRSYPDTINPEPMKTQSSDGVERTSQPLPAIINIPAGGRALLRISDLNVTEYHTLASLGIPMHVIGINAKLLRDQDGNNMAYDTNSITLGGGESLDVILDASKHDYDHCTNLTPCTFYLFTPQLDHLSNDAENFGGMMTEIHVGSST